jgi:hypothetical protein
MREKLGYEVMNEGKRKARKSAQSEFISGKVVTSLRNKSSACQHYWMEVNAMADAVVAAVTSGLASAVAGGALTYVTAVLKIRRDLAAQ